MLKGQLEREKLENIKKQMTMSLKKQSYLKPISDFSFCINFINKEIAKEGLEILLNKKIGEIINIERQAQLEFGLNRFARVDTLIITSDAYYIVEMQQKKDKDLEYRIAKYGMAIGSTMYNEEYRAKEKAYICKKDIHIIFICGHDYYKLGELVYEYEKVLKNHCDNKIIDNINVSIFNTKFKGDISNDKLRNFMTYLNTFIPCDEYTKKFDNHHKKIVRKGEVNMIFDTIMQESWEFVEPFLEERDKVIEEANSTILKIQYEMLQMKAELDAYKQASMSK